MKRIWIILGTLGVALFFTSSAYARGCSISDFNMSPEPPYSLGTHVQLYVKSNCGTVRFEINGVSKAEIGSSEQWETWKTEEFGSGTHTVCAVARGDGGWSNADRRCRDVYVSGGQGPGPNTTPGPDARCYVTSFTVTPGSGPIGARFNLSSQGQCDGNMRAARFTINGNAFAEHSNNTYSTDWNSSGYSVGTHTICYQVTAGAWNKAAQSCTTISLTSEGSPPGNDVSQGDPADNGQPPQTGGGGETTTQPNSASCVGAPLSLGAGDIAHITPGLDNNLRKDSSTGSSLIGSIPAGARFTIIGGPSCSDGYWWWEVNYNGKQGWTAQGSGSNLWISKVNSDPTSTPRQPNPTSAPPPTDAQQSPIATPTTEEDHACSRGGCVLRESGVTNRLYPIGEPYRGTCPGQESLKDRIKDFVLGDWIVRFPVEQWGEYDPKDVRLWGEWFTGVRNTRLSEEVAIISKYQPITLCISGWTFFPSSMWIWLKP